MSTPREMRAAGRRAPSTPRGRPPPPCRAGGPVLSHRPARPHTPTNRCPRSSADPGRSERHGLVWQVRPRGPSRGQHPRLPRHRSFAAGVAAVPLSLACRPRNASSERGRSPLAPGKRTADAVATRGRSSRPGGEVAPVGRFLDALRTSGHASDRGCDLRLGLPRGPDSRGWGAHRGGDAVEAAVRCRPTREAVMPGASNR